MATARKLKVATAVLPTTTYEDVTPEMAQKYLEKNKVNRHLRQKQIDAYARDMKNGHWRVSHQGLAFNVKDEMVDGQHRCHAIIQSGTTVTMAVTHNLPDDAIKTVDGGIKRSVADMLHLQGHQNRMVLAAIARVCCCYEAHRTINQYGNPVTNDEQLEWVEANRDVAVQAAHEAANYSRQIPIPPSVVGAGLVLTARISETQSEEFFASLANMQTTGEGDPRLALLRRCQSAVRNEERIAQPFYLGMVARAWNGWRQGQRLAKMPLDKTNRAVRVIPFV